MDTDTKQALQELRKTVKLSVRERGIYLVARFRYEPSAKWVAKTAKALGGTAKVNKYGKMGRTTVKGPCGEYETFTKDWVVEFTVGIDEDLYLAGRINMHQLKELKANPGAKAQQPSV